jgi:aspartate carbamoyltransferase catalytic subunit
MMLLRVQHEGHDGTTRFDPAVYHDTLGLTQERMNRLKPSAIVLHPAPVNRGVEISDELVGHPQS